MNHWFLVGRDIMWLVVAYLPVSAAFFIGYNDSNGTPERVREFTLFLAMLGQPILLAAVYFGVIK